MSKDVRRIQTDTYTHGQTQIRHTHNVILLSHKKVGNLAIWNNMGGSISRRYAKWNQLDRKRQIP